MLECGIVFDDGTDDDDAREVGTGRNAALALRRFIKMNLCSVTEIQMAVNIIELRTEEPEKHRKNILILSTRFLKDDFCLCS